MTYEQFVINYCIAHAPSTPDVTYSEIVSNAKRVAEILVEEGFVKPRVKFGVDQDSKETTWEEFHKQVDESGFALSEIKELNVGDIFTNPNGFIVVIDRLSTENELQPIVTCRSGREGAERFSDFLTYPADKLINILRVGGYALHKNLIKSSRHE